MLTILLGNDYFAKEKLINQALEEKRAERKVFTESDELPDLRSLSGATLFGPELIFVFDGCFGKLNLEHLIEYLPSSSATVFVVEDSLDKRKTSTQKLLKTENIVVRECGTPKGPEAIAWIVRHCADLGGSISNESAGKLYQALCPEEESLPVLTTHNELSKLITYADGAVITPTMVELLTVPAAAIDVFALLDAITKKQKSQAMQMMATFFEVATGDEKTKAIQISSLLADQMRNLLLVKDAIEQRMSDSEITSATKWKSGRLFVLRKLSAQLTKQQIRSVLTKLENLDLEMKTGTLPQHVVLDVIIAGM